jgi:hypothetical protein
VLTSSKIVEDMEDMRISGLASVLYFYFDFKDINKQSRRALLSSFLVQLCSRSDPFCDVLSHMYSTHDHGARQPSDDCLMRCLKEVLSLPGQGAVYMIMDALDECPNKPGMPSPREEILGVIQELVGFHLPNLHLCIISRPEVDIRAALEPLTSALFPFTMRLDRDKILSTTSSLSFAPTQECRNGGRRIGNSSSTRYQKGLTACKTPHMMPEDSRQFLMVFPGFDGSIAS